MAVAAPGSTGGVEETTVTSECEGALLREDVLTPELVRLECDSDFALLSAMVNRRVAQRSSNGARISRLAIGYLHLSLRLHARVIARYAMCFTTASPNSLHFTSFAPGIIRAKS